MIKQKKPLDELRKALELTPLDYHINVEMGFYYLDIDKAITYRYLRVALKYCDSPTDQVAIERLIADMEYVYPELMAHLRELLVYFPKNVHSVFKAVAVGVETHGLAHLLEEKYPQAKIHWVGDLSDIKTGFFHDADYLMMDGSECLGHLPRTILRGLSSILNDDGKLLLKIDNASWYREVFSLLDGTGEEWDDEWQDQRAFTRRQVEELLDSCGYDIEIKLVIPEDEESAMAHDVIKDILKTASTYFDVIPSEDFMVKNFLIRASKKKDSENE